METIRLQRGKVMPLGTMFKVFELKTKSADDFIAALVEDWVQEQNIHIYDIKYSTSGDTSSALIIYSQLTD